MLIDYVCVICGKNFSAYQRRTTCSKKCLYLYQQKRRTTQCSLCGKDIERKISSYKNYKNSFCSKTCQFGFQSQKRVKYIQLRDKEWCQNIYKTHSLRKIADELGCGETIVWRFFKLHHIPVNRSQWISKDKHYAWKNGITKLSRAIRTSQKYKRWKVQVRQKNINIYALCGSDLHLEIDHIKKFKFILLDNHIETLEDAYNCLELWDVNNGRILCSKCNKVDCNINRKNSP